MVAHHLNSIYLVIAITIQLKAFTYIKKKESRSIKNLKH